MLRILHTADWHLGKKLNQIDRLEEQKEVMEEIIHIAGQKEADVILIAGDLYDHFAPSTEAMELFYQSLKRLSDDGRRPVIAIAGNHDSPDRIEVSDPLARACGIILIGHPQAEVRPFGAGQGWEVSRTEPGFFELTWEDGRPPLRLIHTPFANEYRMKTYLGIEDPDQKLREVLRDHWQNLADKYCDDQGVNILMTHLYVAKRDGVLPEEPEGEKPIVIGNAQIIYSDHLPDQIQYAALGHLHRHQNVRGRDYPVVYSSSPLCYSFAEAGQTKYVIFLESTPGQPIQPEPVALTSGRPLFRKKFHSVDDAVIWLTDHPVAWIELTLVSDRYLTSADKKRLYAAHDGIVTIIPEIQTAEEDLYAEAHQIELDKSMSELFSDYFMYRHGQDPSEELIQLFKEIQSHNS